MHLSHPPAHLLLFVHVQTHLRPPTFVFTLVHGCRHLFALVHARWTHLLSFALVRARHHSFVLVHARRHSFSLVCAHLCSLAPVCAHSYLPAVARVFSSSKETCTLRRANLSPSVLEALQVLKSSYKQDRLMFTSDFIAEEADYSISGLVSINAIDELMAAGRQD